MIFYKLNTTSVGTKKVYGIDAVCGGTPIKSITAVSESLSDMDALSRLCSEARLEPCHLESVIEDYLTDFSL